jgi:dipeptidyl aminopeptidase/acylaminoacyl peptidase
VRAIVPEDLLRFRFITDVQLSPDGELVAYVLRTVDRERDRYRSAIWLVPAAGGTPRQLTSGENEDLLPRWSPNGRHLAFVSDRGEVPKGKERAPRNLWIVDRDGNERQRTRLDNDVRDAAWSPDGRRLVIVAKANRPDGASEPTIRVYDRLRYRSDDEGFLDLRRRHLWILDATDGPPAALTDGDYDDVEPSWSADGREIAFISNRTEDRDRNTIRDVWVTDLAGNARRLTSSDGPQEHPSYSPDGRAVAYYGHRDPRAAHAINVHVWVSAADAPAPRDLVAGWDRTAGSVVITDMRGLVALPPPAWTPDGTRLFFVGSDQGTAQVYEASRDGGTPRQVTRGQHQVVTASFDRERRRFAALVSSATEPGDVYLGDAATGALRRLTGVNSDLLRGAYVASPESIRFSAADGWDIDGWVLKPEGFDARERYPLVLQIHGGPHTAYGYSFFHEFQSLVGRGYVVLYTNPRGSQSYGERFAHACVGDWGGRDYQDLLAAVDHLVARGYVDPTRLGVTGGSYGGFMTNWIIGHTDRFAAAVTARSISNNLSSFGTSDIGWHFWEYEMGDADPYTDPQKYARFSPLAHVRQVRTPLLILHAENDYRCPIEQAEQFFTALQYLRKPVRLIRYGKDSHELTRGGKPSNRVHHLSSIIEWFDRYLGEARAAHAEAAK